MRILFPTDYSANAQNAFQYACHLAKVLGASITIFHSYQVPVLSTDSDTDTLMEKSDKIYQTQLTRLKSFIKDFVTHDTALPIEEITIDYKVQEEQVVDAIVQLAPAYNYIIMGTQGDSNRLEKTWGSTTSQVIEKVKIPVLAIPENAKYHPIKKIMLAEDFENDDQVPIETLNAISQLVNAHVYILHVSETRDFYSSNRKKNYQKIKYEHILKLHNFSFEFYNDGYNKKESIESVIKGKNIDMLAMMVRDVDKVGHLYKDSMTRSIVLDSKIPIFVFHS